jgi:hypothetical protein
MGPTELAFSQSDNLPGPFAFSTDYNVTRRRLLPQLGLFQSLDPVTALPRILPYQPITSSENGFCDDSTATLPKSNLSTHPQFIQQIPSTVLEEDGIEEVDIEGVRLILYAIPSSGGSRNNSSIEFVMQNCKAFFDILCV